MRNPIANHAWKFNKAAVVMPKKGRGAFKRIKGTKADD